MKPLEKIALEDGFDISFGPLFYSNHRYTFREDYSQYNFVTSPSNTNEQNNVATDICNDAVATQSIQEPMLKNHDEKRVLETLNYQKELSALSKSLTEINEKNSKLSLELEEMRKRYQQLLEKVKNDAESIENVKKLTSVDEFILNEIQCTVCSEYMVEPTSLNCSHIFCASCIEVWKRTYRQRTNPGCYGVCPLCRVDIKSQHRNIILENLINHFLNRCLNEQEKEARSKMIEERRQLKVDQASEPSFTTSLLRGFLEAFRSENVTNLVEPESERADTPFPDHDVEEIEFNFGFPNDNVSFEYGSDENLSDMDSSELEFVITEDVVHSTPQPNVLLVTEQQGEDQLTLTPRRMSLSRRNHPYRRRTLVVN